MIDKDKICQDGILDMRLDPDRPPCISRESWGLPQECLAITLSNWENTAADICVTKEGDYSKIPPNCRSYETSYEQRGVYNFLTISCLESEGEFPLEKEPVDDEIERGETFVKAIALPKKRIDHPPEEVLGYIETLEEGIDHPEEEVFD